MELYKSLIMSEILSDRSRSRHRDRRPNNDNKADESFDSTDDVEDDPVVLERREKQVGYFKYLQGSAKWWVPGCVNAAGKARQKW